jgi:membrane fusion protein (multidrug efflux system)
MASETGIESTDVVALKSDDEGETYLTPAAPPEVMPENPRVKERRSRRRVIVLAVVAAVVILAVALGVPRIIYSLNHVSTDDAMFNSHVTFLSARIADQATEVLVDDNQFVEKGQLLVRLDRQPFELAVEQRQAGLDRARIAAAGQLAALGVANANLDQARTQVGAQLAGLKAAWFLVETVQDLVRYEVAALESGQANLRQQKANLQLAQEQYDRVVKLGAQSVSQEEIDQRRSALEVARDQVSSADASLQQTRALLSLPKNAQQPGLVPSDVAQTFNGTQYAVASFQQAMAGLGLHIDIASSRVGELKDKYESLALDRVVEESPAVKVAAARVAEARAGLVFGADGAAPIEAQPAVVEAQKALEDAQLQLAYTNITSPLAGFISRRSVNPGTHVAAGQALLAIRPLSDVWVDANFKETQLADLRVGQPVDLYADAYPGKVFHGRVAGFSAGTGAVISLLPPENATGNFVKVVQRLPVRIDVDAQSAEEMRQYPLFAGLSVEPEVDIKAQPSGSDAGMRLLAGESAQPTGTDKAADR